jgi:DNA-3-methyladenine glycosylase I
MKNRCEWTGNDTFYVSYHDKEWGVPSHDDRYLFEMLILEGAQAGLSCLTILRKRGRYRTAFDNFDVRTLAAYSEADIHRLLEDPGIIRNRLKIESAIRNARAVLDIQQEYGSFDIFIWRYVDHIPKQNAWSSLAQVPARTVESDMMSRDLKKCGFKFVGSRICYAFMQAVGMVNDHVISCYRYNEIRALHKSGIRK